MLNQFKSISAMELHTLLTKNETKPILLDVREQWEYNTCHLPNSKLISMKIIPARYLEFDKSKDIVVYCHHGIRSRMVAQFLTNQGFTSIINLTGGISAWAKEIDPSMPTY